MTRLGNRRSDAYACIVLCAIALAPAAFAREPARTTAMARDGLLPVPGDGRYEWSGIRDMDEVPSEFNPP